MALALFIPVQFDYYEIHSTGLCGYCAPLSSPHVITGSVLICPAMLRCCHF